MIKIKKAVCMFLAALSVFAAGTAGCSFSSKNVSTSSSNPIHIKYWVWDNTDDYQGKNVEMFNITHDNIKVDLEVIGYDNYHDKLMTSVSQGNGPDVFNMQSTWIPEFVDMDALVQMDDLMADWSGKDDIYDDIWKYVRKGAEGKIFAIPVALNVYFLYCRKDLFEVAGVQLPETIDQFYDACRKLTIDTNGDGSIDVSAFGMRGARMGHAMWMGLAFSDGPDKISLFDNSGKVNLNNKQLIKSTEKYIALYKSGYVPRTSPKDGISEMQHNFLSGATAMIVHHMGAAKKMNDKFGDKLEIIPMPRGEAGRVVPVEMVVNGMLKASDKKAEALEFIKWWSSTESNDYICQNTGATSVLKSVNNHQFYQTNKFAKLSIDSLKDGYLIPPTPEMGQWTEVIWPQESQKALLGQSSPEQFIKTISSGLKPIKNN